MVETAVVIHIPTPLMQLGLDQNEIEQRINAQSFTRIRCTRRGACHSA